MDKHVFSHRQKMLASVAAGLERNGFTVVVAESAAAAVKEIGAIIRPDETVGFGGSQTVEQLAIPGMLMERGQKVLYQKPGMSRQEVLKLRHESLTADVFIGSPNAITADGKMLFVDKIGNRAAAMFYGPKKVIAVAGYNKIVTDENAAWDRVDNTAAPINARRLGLDTPCAVTGTCADCNSKDRICNIAVTLMKKPAYTDYYVILVPEELGY